MSFIERTWSLLDPHRRALRLIDDELDAERGEEAPARSELAWLSKHLDGCESCRTEAAHRRALMEAMLSAPAERAPTGFAGRVLMAAKARADLPDVAEEVEELAPSRRFAFGGLIAVAMAAGVFVFAGIVPGGSDSPSGVQVSGHGTEVQERPHFVVRAPGVGAAKVRTQITTIVDAHDGTLSAEGDDVLVRIPRAQLIATMHDLAQRGRFKISKADAGEIGPEVETIVIRFELD